MFEETAGTRQRYARAIEILLEARALYRLPEAFESAALQIERHGWWKKGWVNDTDGEGGACCVWLGVSGRLEEIATKYSAHTLTQLRAAVELTFLRHFNVTDLDRVFELNDKQPDHDGQVWATHHLRAMARQIRELHDIKEGVAV